MNISISSFNHFSCKNLAIALVWKYQISCPPVAWLYAVINKSWYLESFKLQGRIERFSLISWNQILKLISEPHSIIHLRTQYIFFSSWLNKLKSKFSQRASLDRLHCGSKSIRTVLYHFSASFTAVLKAIVVFPTPHLLFKKTSFLVLSKTIIL